MGSCSRKCPSMAALYVQDRTRPSYPQDNPLPPIVLKNQDTMAELVTMPKCLITCGQIGNIGIHHAGQVVVHISPGITY